MQEKEKYSTENKQSLCIRVKQNIHGLLCKQNIHGLLGKTEHPWFIG